MNATAPPAPASPQARALVLFSVVFAAAAYAGTMTPPEKASRELVLMIFPYFRGSMYLPASRAQ